MAENEALKRTDTMMSEIDSLKIEVGELKTELKTYADLKKQAADVAFQNLIADVFRYIRDGIVAKATSTEFLQGIDCMSLLYSPQDLEYPDQEEYEESEVDEINAIAEVDKKKADYAKASDFLTFLGLDASLVRDLRVFNRARNDDTHYEDFKLRAKSKITNSKNQEALIELRTVFEGLDEGHAAFYLKDRLISWCDNNIVNFYCLK